MPAVSFSYAHLLRRLDYSTYVERSKEAVVFGEERLTYGQLRDRVARLASALVADGVKPGDRVAVLLRNDLSWFDIFFAVAAVGGVMVPVNFLLKAAEVAFVLKDSGASTLICGADLMATSEQALAEVPGCTRLLVVGSAAAAAPRPARFRSYEQFRDAAEAVFPEVEIKLTDTTLLQYTSGTTGFPKGAQHTVSSLMWMSHHQVFDFDIRVTERYLCLPSLCWAAGLHDFTLATLWVGGTVVLFPSGGLEISKLLETIAKERINRVLMVPTVLKQVVEHPNLDRYDFSHWQYILCGAEAVPVPVIEKCQKVLPTVSLIQGYGLSEGPTLVAMLRAEDAVRKIGSCGRATSNTEVRIVDDEDRDVKVGETGELIVRSPATMVGYWNRPDANEEVLRNGWLHTGDLASVDDEGYFTIRGRKKDMFISGGLNVYPAEIEAVILASAQVLECAVVGVDDEKWGEVGHAVLVAKPGVTIDVEAIQKTLKDQLASYKLPKRMVVWTEALPRTASGKVRKFVVRDKLLGNA